MPPRNKTTEKSNASKSDRTVIHPELRTELRLGDNALTVAQAKELLGWQEGEGVTESVPDGLTTLTGKKVKCENNQHNRPYTDSWSAQLAQDILNRNWADSRNGEGMTINGETVNISTTGQVLSGQHRLIALCKAAETWAGPQADHWKKKWETEPTMECLLVYGIGEHPHVTRTLDNVRPRDLGDVFCTDTTLFAKASPSDRKVLTKMMGNAIRLLWGRTGAKDDELTPHLSNSEACDFVERHPKLKHAVKHIWDEYSSNWAINSARMPAGYASAFLYLMAASDSDPKKYEAKGRKESTLNMDHWDKAQEFWTLMAGGSEVMDGVRTALAGLYNENGEGNPSSNEKIGIVLKAWNDFKAGKKIKVDSLELKYSDPDEDGHKKLIEFPKVGGIDLGGKKEDSQDEPDTTEEKPEKKKSKADQAREDVATLQAAHPDLLLFYVGPNRVTIWQDQAQTAALELGLVTEVDKHNGMMLLRFPIKDLDENFARLKEKGLRIGLATMDEVSNSIKVKERKK
jgi:hypothetical protein